MKTTWMALMIVVLAACSTSTAPEVDLEGALVSGPVQVTLAYGEDRFVEGTVIRLSFGSVLEDSRCPTDVQCVWEGNGRVQVGIGAGSGPTHPLELNTSLEPQSAEWNDVLVTLVELTPAPVSDATIRPEDYAVTLRLERR